MRPSISRPPSRTVITLVTLFVALVGCEKVPTFQELTGQQQSASPASTPNTVPVATPKTQQPIVAVEVPKPVSINPEKFLADFSNKPSEAINDADLKTLATLESGRDQIKLLNLTRGGITDEGLQNLTQLPALNELDLTTTSIAGHGLAALEKCPNLRKLKVSTVLRMTSLGWEAISRLSQLEVLDVSSNSNISETDVAKFKALTNLRELNLSETSISDEVFLALADMEGLEILKIEACGRLQGHGLQAYARAKPKLRELHARRTQIATAGLRHLKMISSLEFLDISGSSLTDPQFADLRGANNIVHLKIGENFLTNAGMQVVPTLGKLKILDLEGMQNISDPGLGIIAKKSGLQSLNVRRVSFSPQAIQAFQKIQ